MVEATRQVATMAAEPLVLPPHHMLSAFRDVNVCAPMVRYSKLPFRAVVAQYETHITTTPMILATEFSRHPHARDADFSTNAAERGTFTMSQQGSSATEKVRGALVCQLAASEPGSLADAAELVSPFVDGIDLNCGWYVARLTPVHSRGPMPSTSDRTCFASQIWCAT